MTKNIEWQNLNKLVNQKKVISFVDSNPSLEVINKYFLFFKKNIKKVFKKNGPKLFTYADIKGDELLRSKLISVGLLESKVSQNMILITNGCQEAIKLIIETILKKDEKIMIEKINYIGIEKLVTSSSGNIVCFTDFLNELNLIEIEKQLRKNKPKVVYLIPDYSNPCGNTLKKNVRNLFIKLAKELSFWIIEDQTYKELFFEKKDKIKSMFSKSNRTIIVGSVSKTIAPGLRVGWLATKNNLLMNEFVSLKESFTLSTSTIDQHLVIQLLETDYKKMINWVRNYYKKKMKKTIKILEKTMPKEFKWNYPQGGFFIWVEGPNNFQSKKTLNLALNNGVAFTPGELFYYNDKKQIRLDYL